MASPSIAACRLISWQSYHCDGAAGIHLVSLLSRLDWGSNNLKTHHKGSFHVYRVHFTSIQLYRPMVMLAEIAEALCLHFVPIRCLFTSCRLLSQCPAGSCLPFWTLLRLFFLFSIHQFTPFLELLFRSLRTIQHRALSIELRHCWSEVDRISGPIYSANRFTWIISISHVMYHMVYVLRLCVFFLYYLSIHGGKENRIIKSNQMKK